MLGKPVARAPGSDLFEVDLKGRKRVVDVSLREVEDHWMSLPAAKIVVTERFEPSAIETLRAVGQVVELDRPDEATLLSAVRDADAVVVRTYTRITKQVIEAAPRLRVIGRGGVGVDNIDIEAAKERGIVVVYTPAAATDAVADLAVGLMISVLRKINAGDQFIRQGRFFDARESSVSREMSGLTLGIVGMGRIGRAVARRCHLGFNMRVVYNDIVDPGWLETAVTPVPLMELLSEADVVSLHVPLTDATRGMINAASLARCKRNAILINTARGQVVDSDALASALFRGELGGAGLDVTDPEPLPVDHPLLALPQVVVTPHIGARTVVGLARMNAVVEDVVRVLRGKPAEYAL